MGTAGEIRRVAAAAADRDALAAAHDALLSSVVAEFRTRLATPQITEQELRTTAKLAAELAAVAGTRLELAAHEAEIISQILAATTACPARWLSVLRKQQAHAESLASTLRVTVEILEACDDVIGRSP